MELELICPICGKQGYKLRLRDPIIKCDNCATQTGSIFFGEGEPITQDLLDKTAIYLFYHPLQEGYRCFLGSKDAYEEYKNNMRYVIHILPEQVEAWYPRTFAQKIDKILLYIYSNTTHLGEALRIFKNDTKKLFFCNDFGVSNETMEQIRYIANYLFNEGYLQGNINENLKIDISLGTVFTLTPKALARVDELQRDISNNKDVFVAMSFHNTEDIREAIRRGILEAGFSDKFIDEIIHNQQIVPYMMRLIRECRFLIMDITDPNYGAYYEAGYALGLGKEVIITCKKDVRDRKDFKCDKDETCKFEEKALKPHFDIAQKQILGWEDTADLTKQLKEWILELSTRKR